MNAERHTCEGSVGGRPPGAPAPGEALLARLAREAGTYGVRCEAGGSSDALPAAVLSERSKKGRGRLSGRCEVGGSSKMTPSVAVLPVARVRNDGIRTGRRGAGGFLDVAVPRNALSASREHGAGRLSSCCDVGG